MRRRTRSRPLPTVLEAIGIVAVVIAVGVVVVEVAPKLVGSNQTDLAATLSINATAVDPSSIFWSVGAHAPKYASPVLSAALNATPIESFRFGAGGDYTNVSAGLSYDANGTATKLGNVFQDFLTLCRWRSCQAIFAVPAEINSPGAVADTVRYVEQTLGYRPDYWSIGNEPQEWTHYGIPWTSWRTTDDSTPTPQQYAVTVQRDIAAMRSVDPGVRVIGIQSAYEGIYAEPWIAPLVALDGPNLSAIAYHSYPASLVPEGGGIPQFLANGYARGFPNDYQTTVREVRDACPRCHIPVFVDEYNGAGQGADLPLVATYADVPLVAAAAARGLALNVSQFSFFDLAGTGDIAAYGMIAPDGTPRPTYYLYSEIFHNLSTDLVQNASVVGGPTDVAAIVGTDPTVTSLFVVNVNASVGVTLNVSGSGFPLTGAATVWSWDPGEPFPDVSVVPLGTLGTTWTVPPEGLLLIDEVR